MGLTRIVFIILTIWSSLNMFTDPPLTSPVIKQVVNPETPLSSEITIQAGAMLNLSCEVTGGKPRVLTVKIRCDGINPSRVYTIDGDRVTGYLWFTVMRNFNNHTLRHVLNSTNKILTLICDAAESEENYSFSPFTHFWGKPILDNDSKQNQIVYAVLGKTVVLKRKIFSNSNITLHMWINQLDQNVTGRLSRTNVTLDIYSIVVKDAGYLLTLKISNISKGDLGLYTLHVCNNDGCGDFYTTLKVAISEPIMSPDPILIPAASGAAGFVILLAVVVVIICVIKKKRRNSQTNKNNNDSEHDSVNQTDKQGEETVMEDNELYFMPSNRKKHKKKPVMEDNELYFSSKKHKEKQETDDALGPDEQGVDVKPDDELGPDEQGVDVKPEDASAMYSVINKHRNRASDDNTEPTGNDINSVFSVANGEDKQPGDEDFSSLYSTVNKHPQTVADDNTKPTDEDTNALYSVVNKKSKTKANDSTTHPGEEEEAEINDLYSVVNKKSKTERDDNTDPTA
ncbi:uncharacterized protein LOC121385989 [Gigantopelta aegis]|uniref:uncharacterized protein LOC121385989 n=1 Tax=Gigantopelta aegis TaxID=1735272 RepID=UPI001B88C10B|nr:uncharacterized protein LOC121385989 [Gigantopelta aegis]